jgi:predicted permease
VVVLADSLWRRRFGADPGIVGRSIVLDGTTHAVVGVLPRDVRLPRGEQLTRAIDVLVPMRITVGWVGDHNNHAIGRLRSGVTIDGARAELQVLQRQVSDIATKEAHEPVTLGAFVDPLSDYVVGRSRRGLLLLLAAIGSVLLIACSNLANLSLTRTVGRLREAAIRLALGAGRARIVRRMVIEQLILSAAGGTLGLWIAWLALGAFVRTAPIDLPRVDEVHIEPRVLLFAAAVAMLAGVVVALVPAWWIATHDVQPALRASTPAVGGTRGALRSHGALLAVQVALSVMLLVVTALFAASLMRVLNLDLGFAAERVLAVDLALPGTRYAEERLRRSAYDRLLAEVRALPGVEAATTTSMLPLAGTGQVNLIASEGSTLPMSQLPSANFRFVAPEFFRTLGMTVRRGRAFTDAERDPRRPAPALISEPTAERLWPSEDPIGKRFSRGFPGEQGFEVVGVVPDARIVDLDRTPPLMVYVPYWWRSRASVSLLLKTTVDPEAMLSAVRRAVRQVDPDIAIGRSVPLEQLVDASVAGRRYQTRLFVVFGLVALFIATVGVYAVTAYGVSRRRREMNIRVALGAPVAAVFALIIRQGAAPVLAGVAAGICGALAFGGIVASLLFEVRPRDPMVIAVVATVVGMVGVLTCAFAARQGLSIDPAAALRDE